MKCSLNMFISSILSGAKLFFLYIWNNIHEYLEKRNKTTSVPFRNGCVC
uniref:Uncharacterized protein n=1 Tax=Anguilla anguilla TaxID=7936 RepID=A0A0E9RRS4_ANGAN